MASKRYAPSPDPAKADPAPRDATRFALAVRNFMRELGVKAADIGRLGEMSPAQLAALVDLASDKGKVISDANVHRIIAATENSPASRPTRAMVCRIACLLALAFESKKASPWDLGDLDYIMNCLLLEAGFTARTGREANSAILKVEKERKLKVGWFGWGRFARPDSNDPTGNNFIGPSREITGWVSRLMQASIEPVRIGLSEIESALEDRRVDLIAPFILLPGRTLLAHTVPIDPDGSGLVTGLNAIVHRDHFSKLIASCEGRPKNLLDLLKIETFKVELNFVLHGVAHLILPDFVRKFPYMRDPVFHETIDKGVQFVLAEPVVHGTDIVRIFCADQFICDSARSNSATLSAKVVCAERLFSMRLAFGVNGAESKLAGEVEACINFMCENEIIKRIMEDAISMGELVTPGSP